MSNLPSSSAHEDAARAGTAPEPAPIRLTGPEGDAIACSVVDMGQGARRVVFLHGLVGLNEHWEDVAHAVAGRARVSLLEIPLLSLRGEDCSIQGVTAMSAQFLREHVREPSVLVGNSFGGHVALRLALDQPDLVEALVLAGSSGLIERTMVRGAPTRPSREWLEEKIGELFYDKSRMRQADIDRAFRELNNRGSARAMVSLSKSARRNHLGDRIGEIACPTLLIWGREDVVTPPAAAEEFLSLMPDAQLHWIEACGHAPMMEAPEAFAAAMARFFDELDQTPRE
ncbi:MAG: alpha/beta fold hydrolase [Phycisphaerales bacterium]|nr:alpha/beta fold hydrolase [Phycisphaerales bacterium]